MTTPAPRSAAPALHRRPPSPHRSSRWGEGRGRGADASTDGATALSPAADSRTMPHISRVPLPLTPTLSPRREERRGREGAGLAARGILTSLPSRSRLRATPSPHRFSRWERPGEGPMRARTWRLRFRRGESLNNAAKALTCRCPSPRPFSPRREGRRGERGDSPSIAGISRLHHCQRRPSACARGRYGSRGLFDGQTASSPSLAPSTPTAVRALSLAINGNIRKNLTFDRKGSA